MHIPPVQLYNLLELQELSLYRDPRITCLYTLQQFNNLNGDTHNLHLFNFSKMDFLTCSLNAVLFSFPREERPDGAGGEEGDQAAIKQKGTHFLLILKALLSDDN